MHDDIDWMNASSDCGLAQLCREMDALVQPLTLFPQRSRFCVRRRRAAKKFGPSASSRPLLSRL